MKTLLRIDASARRTDNGKPSYNSISKSLAQLFCDHWQAQNNLSEFIYRDLGDQAPPAITQDWIAAVFTPEEHQSTEQQRLLELSDCLIDELQRADIILISTPMYNYGMPAALKAWFDQVIRINRTFSFDLKRGDFPLRPILSGKKTGFGLLLRRVWLWRRRDPRRNESPGSPYQDPEPLSGGGAVL
ncbi:FMN-dependent NADH-azoreductase [Shewanella algae]|uniref:FMN-dependent NADH-azoreductase n=1 Tax=Shewanella algae TaxID=38313 RepID=UPI0031F52943